MRVPINTNCADCKTKINFGVYAYYSEQTDDTLCIDCGTKRGWSTKQRVKTVIKNLEAKEELKAIKLQTKIELSTLLYYKKTIDLYKLGENDIQLENQIVTLLKSATDYMEKVATPEEKKTLKKLQFEIRKTQEMQKQIREEIHSRIFLLDKEKKKRKRKLLYQDEEEKKSQEEPIEEEAE